MSGSRTRILKKSMPESLRMLVRDDREKALVIPAGFAQWKRGTFIDMEAEAMKFINRRTRGDITEQNNERITDSRDKSKFATGKQKRGGMFTHHRPRPEAPTHAISN